MGEMETKKAKRKKKKKDGTTASTALDGSTDKKKLTMAEYSKAMRKKTLEVKAISDWLANEMNSFRNVTR